MHRRPRATRTKLHQQQQRREYPNETQNNTQQPQRRILHAHNIAEYTHTHDKRRYSSQPAENSIAVGVVAAAAATVDECDAGESASIARIYMRFTCALNCRLVAGCQ